MEDAYRALHKIYRAREGDRKRPHLRLGKSAERIVEAVEPMIDWRLNPHDVDTPFDRLPDDIPPKDIDTVLKALKRLEKSVQFWRKKGGRRGYLEYVSQFVK